jgi:hypothetical protein
VIFCKLVITEYKFNDRGETRSSDIKRYLKKKINVILTKLVQVFDSSNGFLWHFLSAHSEMMSRLAKNNRFQTIKNIPSLSFNLNLLFNLFHGVFDLLATTFSVKYKYSDFLNENIVNQYVRMCYFNFVKIYSYISNNEIIRINQKVVRKMNDEKMRGEDNNNNEGGEGARKKHSFPIQLSKIYLRVVLNIALNRTEVTKNIFYQFRIMEFFYKEIDLEFEVSQIKERFIKIRNNVKENLSRGNSPKRDFVSDSSREKSAVMPSPGGGVVGVPKLTLGLNLSQKAKQEAAPEVMKSNPPLEGGLKLDLAKLGNKTVSAPSLPPGNNFALNFSKLVPREEAVQPVVQQEEEDSSSSVDIKYPLEETPQKSSKRSSPPGLMPPTLNLHLRADVSKRSNEGTSDRKDKDKLMDSDGSSSTLKSVDEEMLIKAQQKAQLQSPSTGFNLAIPSKSPPPAGFKLQLPAAAQVQPEKTISVPPKLNLAGLAIPKIDTQANHPKSSPRSPPKDSSSRNELFSPKNAATSSSRAHAPQRNPMGSPLPQFKKLNQAGPPSLKRSILILHFSSIFPF